jgi:predicted nucleic-acid-binding protein
MPSLTVPRVVEAFDTNVIVRLLVRDEEDQGPRAERAFRNATASGGAWVSQVVLAEVSWAPMPRSRVLKPALRTSPTI